MLEIYFIYFLYGAISTSEFFEYFVAWSWMIARRRLRSLCYTTDFIICYVKLKVKLFDYRAAIDEHTYKISSFVGAGTLMFTHLDLIGGISLWIFEHTNIILQFFMYISIVLLKAPWASLVNFSASWITKTLKFLAFLETSIFCDEAIYFTMFWMIWVSWC